MSQVGGGIARMLHGARRFQDQTDVTRSINRMATSSVFSLAPRDEPDLLSRNCWGFRRMRGC